jgi:hypothetical protein
VVIRFYILKIQQIVFADGLDERCERRRGLKTAPWVLAWATGKLEIS